jgi:glycosyltransferase involved in cell wall biosynthesis
VMRIGLIGHSLTNWGGGIDFLRNLSASLVVVEPAARLHLLVSTRGPKLKFRNALRNVYHGARALVRTGGSPIPRAEYGHVEELQQDLGERFAIHEIDIGNASIARAVRRLALEAVLPAIDPLPERFPVPWVGYVYDFQHRHIPALFTPAECRARDKQFASLFARARSVIVNARSVASDVARFYPQTGSQVFALPFSAAPHEHWLTLAPGPPRPGHGISSRYFIVCNQFWKHKDHGTAFAAYAQLAKIYRDIDLVCTGATHDYRDPDYFPSLCRYLKSEGIESRVHILGMVSKSEQVALLKGAIALLQPTLLEGGPGGGAVFDGVSLGVPCLVSDIEVNRELTEPSVTFFRARDPLDLCRLMDAAARSGHRDQADAGMLRELGRARRRRCGEVLLQAIDAARR